MKDNEFDHQLKVLQPRIGIWHWNHGVSKLKQVTGRKHRELEKVFIAVIAGRVSDDTLQAMHALLEFIFHAQDLFLYNETIHVLHESLWEFHHYKSTIISLQSFMMGGGRERGVSSTILRSPSLKCSRSFPAVLHWWVLPISGHQIWQRDAISRMLKPLIACLTNETSMNNVFNYGSSGKHEIA